MAVVTAKLSAMTSEPVLRVALPVPLPRLFDYRLPGAVEAVPASPVGRRVRVPFGSRELVGWVVDAGPSEAGELELKPALAWLDESPLLQGELWESLAWLARYTHAPLGEVLATAVPATLRQGEPLPDPEPVWQWRLSEAGRSAVDGLRRGTRTRQLAELLKLSALSEAALQVRMERWREAARSLEKRGLVERIAAEADAAPAEIQTGPALNAEQAHACGEILAARGFAPFLLDGVTGSGKTEVYLQAIADCVARGRQALVLVPEIGLTPQTLARFRARVDVPVHVLHSGLNDNERARTWAACARGEARVIVGTRSAVFVPLPEAGLIVVDEEHDASYKQQDGIRYHARDFALVRAKALDVPVLLGSATPSLESLHNARSGRYGHLRLRQRAGNAQPPRVRVLDVRKRPLDVGLAPELMQAIGQNLEAGGQVLVFKNRRGYAPVLLCHDCGWTAHCRRCDASMTVHAAGKRLQCHHCGARQPAPLACPDCGGLALQPQGIGTERLEERLSEAFVDFPVLRIDRGTTQRKDGLALQLKRLGAAPGILVGTQILAKGHDLPHLTLVAVVGVDEGLFSADFRASERLAQQLIQVAGRAGRAQRPGEVWVQTHHPDHPLLNTLINGGYHAFAEADLIQREAAGFPPFAHLALLRAEAQHVEANHAFLHEAAALLREHTGTDGGISTHGPLPAPMPRRAGYHRSQVIIGAPQRRSLHRLLDAVVPLLYSLQTARRVRWSLDVDPIDLY